MNYPRQLETTVETKLRAILDHSAVLQTRQAMPRKPVSSQCDELKLFPASWISSRGLAHGRWSQHPSTWRPHRQCVQKWLEGSDAKMPTLPTLHVHHWPSRCWRRGFGFAFLAVSPTGRIWSFLGGLLCRAGDRPTWHGRPGHFISWWCGCGRTVLRWGEVLRCSEFPPRLQGRSARRKQLTSSQVQSSWLWTWPRHPAAWSIVLLSYQFFQLGCEVYSWSPWVQASNVQWMIIESVCGIMNADNEDVNEGRHVLQHRSVSNVSMLSILNTYKKHDAFKVARAKITSRKPRRIRPDHALPFDHAGFQQGLFIWNRKKAESCGYRVDPWVSQNLKIETWKPKSKNAKSLTPEPRSPKNQTLALQ